MSRLNDYGFRWTRKDLGHHKTVRVIYTLILESDETKEIASIVKSNKEKKFLIEAKCEELDLKGEQEFHDIAITDRFISNIKKFIGEELIRIRDHKHEENI